MSSFHWFLPTNGDGRHVANVVAAAGVAARVLTRPASLAYLGQIARAAEQSGFDAVLTPTGAACEDAWITTAALLPLTERLRFLVAFRPGLPAADARRAAGRDASSGCPAGGSRVNIVTGGDPAEQRAYGDTLSHDERYARTDEFLEVFARPVGAGRRSTHDGAHYDGRRRRLPVAAGAAVPHVYFGGASPAAEAVAARHADVYLAWGEPRAGARRAPDPGARRGRRCSAARPGSASGCTSSPGTPPTRPGTRPTACSPAWTPRRAPRRRRGSRRWSPSARRA